MSVRGRRPGASHSRTDIRAAARRLFAQRGYQATTIRAIALEAGVDPALVLHYFDSKQHLFLDVVELPVDPASVLPAILAGPADQIGLRFARFIVALLDQPSSREPLLGLLRAAASEAEAAGLVREILTTRIFRPAVERLDIDEAPLRVSLLSTQVVGLFTTRYVVRVEPLATLPGDDLAPVIAPTFQRLLGAALREPEQDGTSA